MPKEYLGDSVYVEMDERGFVLTTDNGMGASNTIVLESEVINALFGYAKRASEAAAKS
jgi:hypothetical protein